MISSLVEYRLKPTRFRDGTQSLQASLIEKEDLRLRGAPPTAAPWQARRGTATMVARFFCGRGLSERRSKAMSEARERTGTRDITYDIVSILYHALQGAETYDRYCHDAVDSSDYEIARFFREVQEEEKRRADRAKELLAKVLASRPRLAAE
jgi:hypothetical protein